MMLAVTDNGSAIVVAKSTELRLSEEKLIRSTGCQPKSAARLVNPIYGSGWFSNPFERLFHASQPIAGKENAVRPISNHKTWCKLQRLGQSRDFDVA